MKSHPYFLQQSLSEKVSIIDQKDALVYSDWTIQAGASESYASGEDQSAKLYDDRYITGYEVSAAKKFPDTGGSLTLGHSWNITDTDVNSVNTNLNSNSFSLDYTRPLSQNKDGINDRLAADIATIDTQSKQISLQEQSENYLASKLKKFIDLAHAQEKEKLYRDQLELTKDQLSLAEKKFNQSLIEKTTLLQEQDSYTRADQQWLQSRLDLANLQQELSSLIGISANSMVVELDLFEKRPIAQIDAANFVIRSRSLQQLDFDKLKLKRQLVTYKDKNKANINLTMGIATQGEHDKFFKSLSNRDYSWNVGVNVSYPINPVKESLDIQRAEINIAQIDAQKSEKAIDTEQQINFLVSQINLLDELMAINAKQVHLANQKIAEEAIKYKEARGQKSLLIAAQKNANQAILSSLQTATNYQKTIIDYRATIDQLLD
ncbi:MAG: TolC family protein [Candidatus Thioglobus sp.]|nr:TolC family protein [Candidatus Thioglobus sp.]